MTREQITNECLAAIDSSKCLLTLLSTGVGKSHIAIDCINKICDKVFRNENTETNVLIVVDKKVHIQNWKEEINKWGGIKTDNVEFCCYASLHKYANSYWDTVVLDEVHHVGSEARLEALETINIAYNLIGLSATVSRDLKAWFKRKYRTTIISCTTQDAIESNILPDPTIYLMPLALNNTQYTELYEINKKNESPPIYGEYKDLWVLKRSKRHAFIKCTQKQYVNELDGLVNFYKRKAASGSIIMKNLWLRACGDRLTYLANAKNKQVQEILTKLKNHRTITFCTSIDQSEKLGKNCIHSKNKEAQAVLNTFNKGKIKHITACNMLNEAINLVNCKYGIFANINASESIQIQRIGRALRHKSPIIIIPFFRNTREEEIVRKWMKNYNKNLIKIIYKPEDL